MALRSYQMIDYVTIAVLLVIAVAAQFVSLRFGVSVAIIELLLGIFIGNGLGIRAADKDWLVFLAAIAGVILTFLAGAEVDNDALKRNLRPSLMIGAASFFAPFAACTLASLYLLGWSPESSMLAGVALSETSVAIVYIVLVEGGKSKTSIGSLVLCACFITDLSASIALCVLFVTPGIFLVLLIGALIALVLFGPKLVDWCFRTLKGRSGEPEVKVVLLLVMLLAAISTLAGISAVLPAYVLGLIMSRSLAKNPEAVLHMRTALMAFLGSFFFLAAGMNVQLAAVYAGIVPLIVLFIIRLASKLAGVGFVGRKCVDGPVHYIAWLMATALSFGIIFVQVGLSSNLIDADQFSVLVMVIVMSAVIPTLVAQRGFDPWGEKNGL
jgi:Kef-type K+ transport system membrane component KefB